jgi:hypothetical protein
MPIPNRSLKVQQTANIITKKISNINTIYRGGPSIHFYHRVRELRKGHACITSFIGCTTCVEILYATLLAWDMNNRGAKMDDFPVFQKALINSLPDLLLVESLVPSFKYNARASIIGALRAAYTSLHLMKTKGRLVSNSKCLHFLFPEVCPPMDRTNTLQKLYGNTAESPAKFTELLDFSYDVLSSIANPGQYLDAQWNTCETKLVDNAIIMIK